MTWGTQSLRHCCYQRPGQSLSQSPGGECTSFIYPPGSGKIYQARFQRPPIWSTGPKVAIYDANSEAQLALFDWPGGFGNVLVDPADNSVWIIGSTTPSQNLPGNSVILSQLDPANGWAVLSTTTIYTCEAAYTICNTCVVKRPSGDYVIAFDLLNPTNSQQGLTNFLRATTLAGPWSIFGTAFTGAQDIGYVGAPKLFFVNAAGWENRCFMAYNGSCGTTQGFDEPPFFMNYAYTDDVNFGNSWVTYKGNPDDPLGVHAYPDYSAADGIDCSDGSAPLDMGNFVFFSYAVGNQGLTQPAWSQLKSGVYPFGGLAAFFTRLALNPPGT